MYSVYYNDRKIDVYSCRVSALPLNRLWAGEQRPLEQTEIAYYAMFDIEEGAKLKIEVNYDFNDYQIRPLNFDLKRQRKENSILIDIERPMQFSVEIDGKHYALHIFANPKQSEYSICKNDIFFKRGYHDIGLLWLKSNQNVYFEDGAVVSGVIYGKDVQNVRICGRGILTSAKYKRGNDLSEGGQEVRRALSQKGFDDDNLKYIGNIVLNNCRDIYVEGLVFDDAPLWAFIVRDNCERISIDNIKIIGQWRYNSDGIDICCSSNITVKNSFIRSFDDCIVVRGAYLPGEEGNLENVCVENCVCWCDWGCAFEIWCGQKSTHVRNVLFKNLSLTHISDKVIDIATWFGSNDTVVENVSYENINVDSEDIYENLVVETECRKGYIKDPNFVPHIFCMYAAKIGKMDGVGTQLHIPADNYDDFNILYRNILLKNIKCKDKLLVSFEQIENLLNFENIIIENSDIYKD